MYISKFLCLATCILLLTGSSCQDQGLYKPGDNVDIVDVDNFKQSLYNIDQGVFLEFYSHWCGACNLKLYLFTVLKVNDTLFMHWFKVNATPSTGKKLRPTPSAGIPQ